MPNSVEGRIDRTLRESFLRVERAVRYRSWILDQVRPFLGARVLEIGCGVGNITADLLDRDRVVAIDLEAAYLDKLQRRIGPRSNLRTLHVPFGDERLVDAVAYERLDSALLINVLEHINGDVAALRSLCRALEPGSKVVIQVPAHGWLFGEADRALGHVRRYGPDELRACMIAAGLIPMRLWQFNALGVLGWFISSTVRREPMFSELQLLVYEALVPIQRALEPKAGVPLGLSIMAIGRTPEHDRGDSCRMVARRRSP